MVTSSDLPIVFQHRPKDAYTLSLLQLHIYSPAPRGYQTPQEADVSGHPQNAPRNFEYATSVHLKTMKSKVSRAFSDNLKISSRRGERSKCVKGTNARIKLMYINNHAQQRANGRPVSLRLAHHNFTGCAKMEEESS